MKTSFRTFLLAGLVLVGSFAPAVEIPRNRGRRSALWIFRRIFACGTPVGREDARDSGSQESARLHGTAHGAPAQCGLALRQGQRRVAARQVQGIRPGRAHRNLQRFVPHSQRAARRTGRWRTAFHGQAAGTTRARRSHFRPDRGAIADLQRLFHRWRRDRARSFM